MSKTAISGTAMGADAPSANNDFDEVVTKLIRATSACQVSSIFTLWRKCAQDREVTAKLSRKQIDLVFGVILEGKVRRLDPTLLRKADGDQDLLLPARSNIYTDAMLSQDRARLREALEKAQGGQPGANEGPANPDMLFDRYFVAFIKGEILGKVGLIEGKGATQTLILSPGFGGILWDGIVTRHVFKIRAASQRKTRLQFIEWCRGRTLPALDDAGACAAVLAEFGEDDACLEAYIESVGQAVGEFPEARKKAYAALAAADATEKAKGRIDRLLTKVQPKSKAPGARRPSGQGAQTIADIDDSLSAQAKKRSGGRQRQVPDRDFHILAKVIGEVDHRKIEKVFAEFTHIIRVDNGALEPGNDATDIFYTLFRHADLRPFDVGIIFAQAIYRLFPFNLDFLDCFFQNNMRFSLGKVMSAFPYLKNAAVWHLKSQADALVTLAQENRREAFNDQLEGFRASRRVLGLLDMKDAVHVISSELYNASPQFEDRFLQREWESRFQEFNTRPRPKLR